MNAENRELLEEVLNKNLNAALDAESGSEEEKAVLKQAMDVTSQLVTLAKNDDSFQEASDKLAADKEKLEVEKERIEIEKQKLEIETQKLEVAQENCAKEEELRKKENIKTWIFRGIELVISVGLPITLSLIDKNNKMKFADKCMDWEVNGGNSFTTTPGRTVKDFFRFK